MILFFDTSALLKRYILEMGSEKVDQLFDSATQIMVSPITKVEFTSAIRRLLQQSKIEKILTQFLRGKGLC